MYAFVLAPLIVINVARYASSTVEEICSFLAESHSDHALDPKPLKRSRAAVTCQCCSTGLG